jgi:formate-dependent nitrite reductase membrane component NrfD
MTDAGYHGHPIVKPPVWTWEVPLYFFVGGASGMSALIAAASLIGNTSLELAETALWIALLGSLISPVLLILDLGRPTRFLNMLRVFKLRSPMSVGAWTLIAFNAFCVASVVLFEGFAPLHHELELSRGLLGALLYCAMLGAAASGVILATYTGVLLGATAIPAWAAHRAILPVHFGAAGLGSAVALIEIFDRHRDSLGAIAIVASVVETVLFVISETRGRGIRHRALRQGRALWLLRSAGILTGPASLLLRLIGGWPLAALLFLVGALLSRYAWVAAGRASAADTEAALAR